jgi:ribosome-associated protein
MISVSRSIRIPEREVQLRFVRGSGPGGQNVNKVASAVELRFDVKHTRALTEEVRDRLILHSGKKLNSDGVLVIRARRFRSQERNRQDAIERLVRLVQKAALRQKPRRRTKPTRASGERRLESKKRRSSTKQHRRRGQMPSE